MQYKIKVSDTGNGQVAIESSPPFKDVVHKAAKHPAELTAADVHVLRMLRSIKDLHKELKQLLMQEKTEDIIDTDKINSTLHLPGRDF